jgi:hypothetical protein
MPVITHYEQLGKCHRISAVPPPAEVFSAVCGVLQPTAQASLTVGTIRPAESQQKPRPVPQEPEAPGTPVPAFAFA